MIVTVDGPAGAGKGTIAGYLSAQFNLAHIDSGRLYRKAGLVAFKSGVDLDHLNEAACHELVSVMESITMEDLNDPDLRLEEIAAYASKVAVVPVIREAANTWIRSFCADIPTSYKGVIVDGRDIGTVVFPHAECKLFVTASEEKRLWRRLLQTGEPEESIQKVLKERDHRDSSRTIAPLKPAQDAYVLDTSDLTIDEGCKLAAQYVVNTCGCSRLSCDRL